MVGRAGQDGHRAIDLLGEHGAGQGVRPGLRPEGEQLVSAGAKGWVVAVGGPDQEDQLALAAVPKFGDVFGERTRGPGLAPLVAGDDARALKVRLEPPSGLVDFDDVDGA